MAESGSSKTYKMLEELEKIESASVNPETREIYLEDIDETTGLWFVRVVNYLSEQNYEPIRIYLNTPGGDVISSFVIHDRIHNDPDITFKVLGTGNVC